MSRTLRIVFFGVGLIAIFLLMMSFDLSFTSLRDLLHLSGGYFPLVLVLWAFIYLVNTLSWKVLLLGLKSNPISFIQLYQITITGFALNYITPGGLNGGEPYRILSLKDYIGVTHATSSTLLYSIVHMGSHIVFWMIAAITLLFIPFVSIPTLALSLIILGAGGILFSFHLLMHKGITHLVGVLLAKIPWLGKWVQRFVEKHRETIFLIDEDVRSIYKQKSLVFYQALGLELLARLIGCFEIGLLLIPIMGFSSFTTSFLIVAISSLMTNLLFFLPMQLGGREGGFTLAFSMLNLSASHGLFIGLLVRLRELIWILIGVLLIQVAHFIRRIKKDS